MTQLVDQPTATPTRKLTSSVFALLAAQGVADLILSFLPPETMVDSALLVGTLEALFVAGVAFVAGYFTRERST